MTAVYRIQRHSCWDVVLRVGIKSGRDICQGCVFEAFRVGVCWLLITRNSKLCVNSESHRFLSQRVESHLWWCWIQFLFASLNHNLEQAVPCLIHSSGLAEVFRYHPSSVFVHRITGPKKLFLSFWDIASFLPEAGGLMGFGLWNPLQCFLPHWAICWGPSGADNNRLHMKYAPWLGHSGEQSICSQQFSG